MSPLLLPFWFKQRQGKAEDVGLDMVRLSGPNMNEAYITIRRDGDGRWQAALRQSADGPDVAATPPDFATTPDAWEAAFELFRIHVLY